MKKDNKKSQEKIVTDYFDSNPVKYANGYSGLTGVSHSFNTRLARVCEMLEGISNKKILDLGCGPGIMLSFSNEHNCEYYGVDISSTMIEESKKLYGEVKSAHFSVGKAEKIEFDDNIFDVVVAMGLVEYLDNDETAIKEIYRVLKPGGAAIITLPNKLSPYRIWDRTIYQRLRKIAKKVLGRKMEKAISHREYTLNKYNQLLSRFNLTTTDCVYYNFKLIPIPFDFIFPALTARQSRSLEFLRNTMLRWLGTGFIVKAIKENNK